MPFKSKSHFDTGLTHKYPCPIDAQMVAPIECKFKLGDAVTFTNDYGVKFENHRVVGFSPTVDNGRFIYIDYDCWWFAAKSENLSKKA